MLDEAMGSGGNGVSTARVDPYEDRTSLEFRFREKRFGLIRSLIEKVLQEKETCEILDLGGTEGYWRIGGDFLSANRNRLRITIVNIEPQRITATNMFAFLQGSATDERLLAGQTFDLVHSNSVIEHVGELEDMRRFAANVRRLAPLYYVQTPNYWFPYEPHFRMPCFQYLPAEARVAVIRRFAIGFFDRVPDIDEARSVIRHHHLLTTRQVAEMFPDASIRHEKFIGLNKSIIAIRG